MRAAILTVVLLSIPTTALAWDGPELWYAPATAASPGGGGIIGTGGQRDHGITCLDCHRDREETTLDVTFTFTPPLDESGPADARYAPGQRYRIDVAMVNEQLGPPCDQYMAHHNNFAANFELPSGAPAGILESDSGQSQASCPPDFTDPTTGTTALYGDCEVVFPRRGENLTSWTFYWTAPSTPAEVRLFYGATDGDCMMTSLGDAVVVGDRTLVAASATAAGPGRGRGESPWPVIPVLVVSIAGLGLVVVARGKAWLVVALAGCGGDDMAPLPCEGPGVSGRVVDEDGAGLASRLTVVDATGAVVATARGDDAGRYAIAGLDVGTVTIGASARDHAYVEREVTLDETCATADLTLGPETEEGQWTDLGDPGEAFGGTNSAVLLPSGRILMCHDTRDPVIVDPVTGGTTAAAQSPRIQGCHAVTVLPDGRVLYVGGADQDVYGPGTTQVKSYDPVADSWAFEPELVDPRWYPTMVALPGGRLLAIGGGTELNPQRSNTSEVMDPATMQWTPAGDIALGNEVSPIVLLYTGEVLMTHRPPQLFDPGTLAWRSTADFVQGDRMPNGDHSDHELQLLPDGRVAALGYKSFNLGVGEMLEIYDPATEEWALGAPVTPVRSRASTILAPDGRVYVIGGFQQDPDDPTPLNEWGQVSLVDVWDPARDAWRRLANIGIAREYHAMPVVVPDGRIFVAGGEGSPGNEPPASRIEAFTPPYLLRGPRPEIVTLGATDLSPGDEVEIDLAIDEVVTAVVMMGTNATTHFMESGNSRYLFLDHDQAGTQVVATVPTGPADAIPGWYLLFVLVDDIPSEARVVRVPGE